MNVWFESMSGVFHKMHLSELPPSAILHHFTGPDEGDPHSHPFDIDVLILMGGYIERIYDPANGSFAEHHRRPGDRFTITAARVHRIHSLPDGPCLTLATYGPTVQKAGFHWWDERGPLHRYWDETEFQRWPREG